MRGRRQLPGVACGVPQHALPLLGWAFRWELFIGPGHITPLYTYLAAGAHGWKGLRVTRSHGLSVGPASARGQRPTRARSAHTHVTTVRNACLLDPGFAHGCPAQADPGDPAPGMGRLPIQVRLGLGTVGRVSVRQQGPWPWPGPALPLHGVGTRVRARARLHSHVPPTRPSPRARRAAAAAPGCRQLPRFIDEVHGEVDLVQGGAILRHLARKYGACTAAGGSPQAGWRPE